MCGGFLARTGQAAPIDAIGGEMPPQAVGAAKKQHLTLLSGMGIREWQSKPAVRHSPFQSHALTLCLCPSLSLLTIILSADTFNL